VPTIFLSYRRSDTGGEVGRLSDTLKRELGSRLVFRDVADIAPGAAFEAVLEERLAAADLVLVLIGPAWLRELEERGRQADTDYHRLEIATALSRGKRVIPVLVNGATLPPADALTGGLEPLGKRQAMTIRDESWSSDVGRLVDAIGRPYRWGLLGLRALAAAVGIVVAVWAVVLPLLEERAKDYGFLRGLVACLVGVYAVIEIAFARRHFKKRKRSHEHGGAGHA